MADRRPGNPTGKSALREMKELIAQRARHSSTTDTVKKEDVEASRRDSPIHLATTVPNKDQKQKHTFEQGRNIGRNIIADTYAQDMVRKGAIPLFNPVPNEEYFALNMQRNGLRDGTAPAGDWIAYGATLWIVMDQFENIDGQPVHLARLLGIYTS